ncbi:hypothetical protein, partial [Dysgonomonas sp. 511]|uniref:hypothetical protein n=1 Tax=Dysgonomonas sp. 511 TaxID=2302930 RepID=UPI0013D00ECC
IGIIAAAFSSADSALTALTTTTCVDLLNVEKQASKRRKTLERELEWVRMAPKARHAKIHRQGI